MRTSPTELLVIDLIAQHDEEPDGQLAGHGDLGRRQAFAKGQAPVDTPQARVVAAGDLRRLDQQEPQQAVALLGQRSETLPSAAGVFARNQPPLAGDVLGVGKALHRPQHQHGAQRRQRTHAGVGHQPLGVFTPRHAFS